MGSRIELAEAIATLRQELMAAMAAGTGQRVQFAVGPVDLEFQTEIGREGGGSGKVRFWVVEAGAEGKLTSASTQVLKIRLEPVDAVTRKPVLVAEAPASAEAEDEGPRPSPAVG